jgi:hypothetical protein
MLLNWNSSLKTEVTTCIDKLLRGVWPASSEQMLILHKTSALPVYSDMSGSLVLTPEGKVLHYNSDSEFVSEVSDDKWKKIAAVSAVETFPTLAGLLPPTPPSAISCRSCSGRGKLFDGKVLCGECGGLGWIEVVQ